MPSISLVLVSNFSLIFNCNFLLVNVGEGSWLVGLSMTIAPLCFVVQRSRFKSHLFSFKFSNGHSACEFHQTNRGGADIADSTW
jgi:hypothetical protein